MLRWRRGRRETVDNQQLTPNALVSAEKTVPLIWPPEEDIHVGGVIAAVDLLLHHRRGPQLVTTETRWPHLLRGKRRLHVCEFKPHFQDVPAVDWCARIRLHCSAAAVSPEPLLGVPGQTLTAVHSETVPDLFAHILASGRFCKISIQQGQITNPCSCTFIEWIILIIRQRDFFCHVFLLLRTEEGRESITVLPSQRCVLLKSCMLGVGLSNILPQQFSFSLTFRFPAFNSKTSGRQPESAYLKSSMMGNALLSGGLKCTLSWMACCRCSWVMLKLW